MFNATWFNEQAPDQQREILDGPAMRPPPGNMSQFERPSNKTALAIGIIITAASVNALLLILRITARVRFQRKVDIEDGLAVAALALLGGHAYAALQLMNLPGAFVHQWNHLRLGSIVYGLIILCLKTGILLHWKNLFVPKGMRTAFWWTCYILLGTNVLFYVTCTFLEIFSCMPIRESWDITMKEGRCIDIATLNVASAIFNLVSDFMILMLPHKVIWSLQHVPLKKKIAVSALFSVGVFATVSAGFRVHSSLLFVMSSDVTYNLSAMGLWSIAEFFCGFLVLCLPAIPKLFKNCWDTRTMKCVATIASPMPNCRDMKVPKDSLLDETRMSSMEDPSPHGYDQSRTPDCILA